MSDSYCLALEKFIKELNLDVIYMPEGEHILTRADIGRPGLALAGYFDYFEPARAQIFGFVETHYLRGLDDDTRSGRIYDFMEKRPACVILARGLEPDPAFIDAAELYEVPILGSDRTTSAVSAAAISALSVALAPRMTQHGVLVEIYGEGVLIIGDSGVGKSEAAIELVKRGHRLIADDAVDIKRVSDRTLVGSAPELIKHYIELRGIGIIDVRRIFGMGAVKDTEKIDLVIKLENWEKGKHYERMGLETEHTTLMGIDIPSLTIPVRPGRNLAIIVEIAAMNHRQRKMGYNTALELENKICAQAERDGAMPDIPDDYRDDAFKK